MKGKKKTLIIGNIYTMDRARPAADAMVVSDGKVEFIGQQAVAETYGAAEVFDFSGKTILPGFIDTHVHVIPSGVFMNGADLSKAEDMTDVLITIEEHAKKVSKKDWILAAFFQDKLIKEKRFPTRKELDGISETQPVLVCHNDLHPIALNSKALEILKVDGSKDGVGVDEG